MIHRLHGAALAATLAPLCIVSSARAAPVSSGVHLSVAPVCVVVGQRASMHIRLTGVRPGQYVSFVTQPDKAGFGGGIMGMRRANRSGTIDFRYAAARKRWEVGTWTLSAYRMGGPFLARVTYRVAKARC